MTSLRVVLLLQNIASGTLPKLLPQGSPFPLFIRYKPGTAFAIPGLLLIGSKLQSPDGQIPQCLYRRRCQCFRSCCLRQYTSDTKNRLKYSFQSVFNAAPALHFRDDKVSIAKIHLIPITVSQLKCALHILIGDWYDQVHGGSAWCRCSSAR